MSSAPSSRIKAWCIAPLLACMWVSAGAAWAAKASDAVQRQVASIDARAKDAAPLRERPVQGLAAEGARVSAWGSARSVEKISFEGLGERGRELQDFYWQRGQLIAVHARRIDYGASIVELPKDKALPMNVVSDEWLELDTRGGLRPRPTDGGAPSAPTRERVAELRGNARSFKRLVDAPEPAAAAAAAGCFWSCAREQGGECRRYVCK